MFFVKIYLEFFIGFVLFVEICFKFFGSSGKIFVDRIAKFNVELIDCGKARPELLNCSVKIGRTGASSTSEDHVGNSGGPW